MYTSNNKQCILGIFKVKAAFDTTSTYKRKRLINSESLAAVSKTSIMNM